MENPTETLLSEVSDFIERAKLSPSTFGKKAVGDPNFVRNLRAGREPRFGTVQRIRTFIAEQSKETA